MRLPNFEIRSQRSIRLARCEAVPSLMVIAGPNGAGKSTLLNSLRGPEHVLYVGPHRAMRRQQVQQRHLFTPALSFETVLAGHHVPGVEGVRIFDGARDAWSYDESSNLMKHALCQIEIDRQQAIASRYDRDGELGKDVLPDPWIPLRTLTHNLLPHLKFYKIDTSNRDAVRCLWQVHSTDTIVDLDELSSGEKSIIQMFYPLVERQIRSLLNEMLNGSPDQSGQSICVLIDEPELHLHPNLQMKVLDYLRLLTSSGSTQVVMATHSPAMVEHASSEELYMLRPAELVGDDENQLVQVASDDERLRALRDVFGGTSNLTAMQPVLVVEGIRESPTSKVNADRKIYRQLHDGFDKVSMVAGGGKSECRALVTALNDLLPEYSQRLGAIALLDSDGEASQEGLVSLLPVAMIENFLIDPGIIWEAIQSVVERTEFSSIQDVSTALNSLLDELEGQEVERRVLRLAGPSHYWPKRPVDAIPEGFNEFVESVRQRYSPDAIDAFKGQATGYVQSAREAHRRREEFHGKEVLSSFYKKHLHAAGLPKNIFIFECARHAKGRKSVRQFFDNFFTEKVPTISVGEKPH